MAVLPQLPWTLASSMGDTSELKFGILGPENSFDAGEEDEDDEEDLRIATLPAW